MLCGVTDREYRVNFITCYPTVAEKKNVKICITFRRNGLKGNGRKKKRFFFSSSLLFVTTQSSQSSSSRTNIGSIGIIIKIMEINGLVRDDDDCDGDAAHRHTLLYPSSVDLVFHLRYSLYLYTII